MTASPIPASALSSSASERTLLFEGFRFGSQSSFFAVDNDPGEGPGLHRHPYTETWHVLEGEATIRVGDDTVVAHAGDSAVVAPNTWHLFTNTGQGRLRMICIHASDRLIQENVEDDPA